MAVRKYPASSVFVGVAEARLYLHSVEVRAEGATSLCRVNLLIEKVLTPVSFH